MRAIIDCADVSFMFYNLKPLEWGMVRNSCEELLDPKGLGSYEEHFQEHSYDEDLQRDWRHLVRKFDGKGTKDINASDHEGQMEYHVEVEACAEDARDKRIAYHQLKAYSEYLAKRATLIEVDSYNRFLVSVVLCFVYIVKAIISRFCMSIGAIQP